MSGKRIDHLTEVYCFCCDHMVDKKYATFSQVVDAWLCDECYAEIVEES